MRAGVRVRGPLTLIPDPDPDPEACPNPILSLLLTLTQLRPLPGYDDTPGSTRAKLCWKGNQMFPALDEDLHFGYQVRLRGRLRGRP